MNFYITFNVCCALIIVVTQVGVYVVQRTYKPIVASWAGLTGLLLQGILVGMLIWAGLTLSAHEFATRALAVVILMVGVLIASAILGRSLSEKEA